jgi:O-acetyl-ADP-ribose deacetylase (regulator of RNase III)
MSIQFVSGDIFLTGANAIAHGCNCRGRMGAGIAKDIKAMHPEMFQEYRRRCYKKQFIPGSYYLYKNNIPWILNWATQDILEGAKPEYLEMCLHSFIDYYQEENLTSLAVPRIAAGLGGLVWEDVRSILIDYLDPLPIPVVVYEEYIRDTKAREHYI